MSKGTVNKVIVLGRLGVDPEIRYMPSGAAIGNLRLATNDGYKDKQTGEFVESTEWHRVVLFGRLAEIAGEYLKKGRMVYIEGRLRTNKWTDQAGQERYTTEIVASEMQLIGGQGGAGSQEPGMLSSESGNNYSSAKKPVSASSASSSSSGSSSMGQPVMSSPMPAMEYPKFEDDDIPF